MNKKDLEIVDNFLSTVTSLDPTGASGFIVDGFKTILSIRDKIYLSKYQEFWRAPEENKIKIEDFIRKTKEQEEWRKVGGEFMLVIDSFSCFDKCYYFGKAWIAWLEKKINVNEFQEIIDILQKVFIGDLNSLIENKWQDYSSSNRLCNCGIFFKVSKIENKFGGLNRPSTILAGSDRSPFSNQKTDAKDFEIKEDYQITKIGEKLIEILKPNEQSF